MKKFNLLLVLSVFFAGIGYSQTTDYMYYQFMDSTQGCTEGLEVSFQIGAAGESGGILTVDWGDGTSDTYNYTAPAGQGWAGTSLQHGYAVSGVYTVSLNVYSTTAGANVDAGQSFTWTAYDPANCGYIYIFTSQTAPSVSYYDVPMDFTGTDGITTTIIPSSANPNWLYAYSGLNLANAPYTVSINDTWLANNGLTQTSPDFTITSFDANGMANPGQQSMTVECGTTAANPDFGIFYSYAWGFIAPFQTGNVFITFCNYACNNTADATVTLDFPAGFVPNTTGLTNATVNGNTLTFDATSVSDCADFHIPFTFPGTTPAGTQVSFTVTLSHPDDSDNSNNSQVFWTTVLNSYDPNDKEVNQPTQLNPNVQEELTYVIHFQNDGNFNALDVVITDEIDADLDLSTFQLVDAKHVVASSVDPSTRVVTFSFNECNLTPSSDDLEGSQGYVVYKIKENAGLPLGTEIENTANIYFDFNPAIVTNTTYNINQSLGTGDETMEMISLFPNPANDLIRFNGAHVNAVQIYDLAGKQLLNASVTNNELSVASLANGIYQVVISTANGISVQKLAIRK